MTMLMRVVSQLMAEIEEKTEQENIDLSQWLEGFGELLRY